MSLDKALSAICETTSVAGLFYYVSRDMVSRKIKGNVSLKYKTKV